MAQVYLGEKTRRGFTDVILSEAKDLWLFEGEILRACGPQDDNGDGRAQPDFVATTKSRGEPSRYGSPPTEPNVSNSPKPAAESMPRISRVE